MSEFRRLVRGFLVPRARFYGDGRSAAASNGLSRRTGRPRPNICMSTSAIQDSLTRPRLDSSIAWAASILPTISCASVSTTSSNGHNRSSRSTDRTTVSSQPGPLCFTISAAGAGASERPLGALRGLDDHHIVLVAGVPLQVIAAHADLVAHEFVAELERIQPVGRNGAVAKADHRAAKNLLEFVLQGLDRVQRIGVF